MTHEQTQKPITPFEELLLEHKIEISALPEKTQKRIAKFKAETDEEKREALDESICGDIWDYIEVKEEEKKKEEKMQKEEDEKKGDKKKIDVREAATAKNNVEGNGKENEKNQKCNEDVFDILFKK